MSVIVTGANIRSMRKEKKLTLRGIAESAGLSFSYIAEIERGEASPSIAILEKLAHALGYQLIVAFGPPDAGAGPHGQTT